MLRTNATEARKAIRNYIINNINVDYLKECNHISPEDPTTYAVIAGAYAAFKNEYYSDYEQHREPSERRAFIDYMKGLPGWCCFSFYYYEERLLLKEWLQETEQEADRYSDQKTDALYWQLITKEFFQMLQHR